MRSTPLSLPAESRRRCFSRSGVPYPDGCRIAPIVQPAMATAIEGSAMFETPIRLALAAAIALLLASCARTQLASDLQAAQAPCRDQGFKDKSALVTCLSEHERPVWARDDPATLDIYDRFAQDRAALARQYDDKAITQQQYRAQLDRLEAESREQLAERHKRAAANP